MVFFLKFGWSFTDYFFVNFEILVTGICHFISALWFHKFLFVWPLSVDTCHWVCVTKRCEFTWTLNFAWYDVEQMSAVSSGLFSSEKLSTTTLLSDFKLSRTFMTIEILSMLCELWSFKLTLKLISHMIEISVFG